MTFSKQLWCVSKDPGGLQLFLLVFYDGDHFLIPFNRREILGYVVPSYPYGQMEEGGIQEITEELFFRISDNVVASFSLDLSSDSLISWNDLYRELLGSCSLLFPEYYMGVHGDRREEVLSDLCSVMPLESVQACFRKHFPELAERLYSAPLPQTVRDLIAFPT